MRLAALLIFSTLVAACGERVSSERSARVPVALASAATPDAIPTNPPGPYVWTHAQSARAAWYGPKDAPALLAVACEGWEKGQPRLAVVRYARADKDTQALLAIQGSKGILRLPVSATRVGDSGYVWRGELDARDARAEVLLGNALKATVPGGGMIELAPLGEAAGVVGECAAAARPAVPAA